MRTIKFLLPLLIPLCRAQSSVIPLPPCTLNFTLSNTNLTSNTFPNNTPSCDKWTVTAYVVGSGSFTLTLQAAPPATTTTPGSWATYPGTVATGSNPLTATGIATFTNGTVATQFLRLLLNVTSGTATVYGVLQGSQTVVSKGGGGGGGGGGPTIAGTAGEIAATGAGCTTPSTATCTISIVNNAALPGAPTTTTATLGDSSTKIATTAFVNALLAGCIFSSGNFTCPGTITAGSGSGTTGALDLVGKTSGATSTVTVDDNNTATQVNLPDDSTSGLYMTTSTTKNPAAGCAQYTGTGTETSSTGTACAGGGGTAGGGVLGYSASALTLPTAGTTFLAPIGGALASTTEANVTAKAPAAAAISNMYVTLSAAPGTGNTIAFTYRDAGSSTALTCTISGAATSCQDITHSFTPTVGDALSIQVVTTGTVVIAPVVKIIAEYGVTGGGGGGGSARGVFASRPSCSTAGSSYFATDVPIISECNASSWADWAYGRNVTLPSAVSFTTVLNSAVINTNGVAQINAVGGNNAYGEDLALPSTPYTLYLGFRCGMITSGGYCGLYVRNSTGTTIVTYAFQALGTNSANFQVAHFSNYTGFSGGVQDFSTPTVNQGIVDNYIAMHDDGTNFTFFICTDRFNCSASLFSQSRTANLTSPGFLGWFATGNSTAISQINMVVFDFTVTQP